MCCGWELAEFVGALNKERFAFALITMGVSACLEAVAVLQPSHGTASTALLGEVGAIKLWELLTNLVTSGIFYYVTVMVTLICKTSECLDLVADDKNTFSLSFCF